MAKADIVRLTHLSACAGCAAKAGSSMLAQVLAGLPPIDDPNVLVGTSTADDAGVYRLSDELALVHTVDFFTPIVDDPASFGRIAATNAISDVYAMGGRPLSALAITTFPEDGDLGILAQILTGGADKAREAGINVIGGHTIKDAEPKYGLAVTGVVHPQKIFRNSTAQPGDELILTKPIGTGILTTARRRDEIDDHELAPAVESMETLNRAASEALIALNERHPQTRPVHAVTDITGFGLVGHLQEVARGSGVGIELRAHDVPFFDRVLELARRDIVPGGTRANHATALAAGVTFADPLEEALQIAVCDAQTSGGLLIAVAAQHASELADMLGRAGVLCVSMVGRATRDTAFRVV
jgi:selenide,water dikinase